MIISVSQTEGTFLSTNTEVNTLLSVLLPADNTEKLVVTLPIREFLSSNTPLIETSDIFLIAYPVIVL